jgi:hypothetical protein
MLCQFCEDLTVEELIELDKEDQKSEYYGSGFATRACYAHHPTFDSLLLSAQEGCEFCAAIYNEFRAANLLKDIAKKKEFGLDTSVKICISIPNKEWQQDPGQIYDRILAGVGVLWDIKNEAWSSESLGSESEVEVDEADGKRVLNALDDSGDDSQIDESIEEEGSTSHDSDTELLARYDEERESSYDQSVDTGNIEDEDDVRYVKFSLTGRQGKLMSKVLCSILKFLKELPCSPRMGNALVFHTWVSDLTRKKTSV